MPARYAGCTSVGDESLDPVAHGSRTERAAVLHALSHPLRHRILDVLTARDATVAELADVIDRRTGDITYHLRVLQDCGAVEPLAGEQGSAGSATYRATARALLTDDEWRELPLATRREIFRSQLDQIAAHIRAASESGGFDPPDAHVSYTTMRVDHAAWQATNDLLMETLRRSLAIEAGATARRRDDGDSDVLDTEVVLLHFRRGVTNGGEGGPAAAAADEIRQRIYAVADELWDEIPERTPNWERIAERASELAALARQQVSQ